MGRNWSLGSGINHRGIGDIQLKITETVNASTASFIMRSLYPEKSLELPMSKDIVVRQSID